jgi:hypothetical protein
LFRRPLQENYLSTSVSKSLFLYRFTYPIKILAHFPPAALMFVLGYTGCDPAAPAALYTAALALTGATPAGAFASAADIAPNFAGRSDSLSKTLSQL